MKKIAFVYAKILQPAAAHARHFRQYFSLPDLNRFPPTQSIVTISGNFSNLSRFTLSQPRSSNAMTSHSRNALAGKRARSAYRAEVHRAVAPYRLADRLGALSLAYHRGKPHIKQHGRIYVHSAGGGGTAGAYRHAGLRLGRSGRSKSPRRLSHMEAARRSQCTP